MSLSYFDDPEKKKAWDKEMSQLRQEKAQRMAGKVKQKAGITAGSVDKSAANSDQLESMQDSFRNTRVQITYKQLLEREYGTPKPVQFSRSSARQMEKSKDMGGINL